MKNILFSLLLISSSCFAYSQSLSRTVIGSAGALTSNSSAQLEFTLGESAVSSVKNSSAVLTEGFNQGYAKKDTQVSIWSDHTYPEVKLFPNPATSYLYLENHENLDISIEVLDYVGKTVKQTMPVSSHSKATLDIKHLPSGIYMIKMTDENNKHYTYRWIKQ